MRHTHIFILLFSLFLGACGSAGGLKYDSPQEAFEKGKSLFDEGKFVRAAEYFQGVFDFGRSHEYAADSRLFLARAYDNSKQYLLAASEYQRFIQIYRNDERVVDAEYEYALTFYKRSPQYQLDQSDTEAALRQMQRFVDRYPASARVQDANDIIRELRQKLAYKQFETAKLYERRDLYEAAAVSFMEVFDSYPESEWADDALLAASVNYTAYADNSIEARKKERYELAKSSVARLLQSFPDSEHRAEAEALHQRLEGLTSGSDEQEL